MPNKNNNKNTIEQNILFLFDMMIFEHQHTKEKLQSMINQLNMLDQEIKNQAEAMINKEEV